MALNTYTAQEVGDVTARLVDTGLHLANHVSRLTDSDFAEAHGGHAYFRVPTVLTARARDLRDVSTQMVFDRLNEARVSVDLTTDLVSGVRIGDAEYSLDLQDYSRQVLRPQTDSIADGIDAALADVLAGIDAVETSFDPTTPARLFTEGRRALRNIGVDVANEPLVAFVGGNVIDALLDSDALDFAATGDANALRAGSIGRVRGFEVVETARGITADEVVFAPRNGLYVATVAPKVPEGVTFGASTNIEGVAVRYLRDYDSNTLSDRSIVSVFVGAGVSPFYDVARDEVTGTATATPVEGGAVVKFTTTA